jgi:hypothetical protein
MDQYTIKVLCRKEWEAGVKHGIKCEQQRIIKLLDAHIGVGHCDFCNYDLEGCEVAGLIVLIKKEK